MWVKDFYSWDVCDQAATNLFRKTDFIWDKVFEWFDWEGEFQRRAGFANLAVLTVHHKTATDHGFLQSFPYLEKYAADERNFVKKAINWAIREMGKRRKELHQPCIDLCYRLVDQDSKSAKWIARDALRELQSEKVQERLNKIP
jgi:3-methyladenine DNA glycosylase AlkD